MELEKLNRINMEIWMLYAILSMVFAGVTSILAKDKASIVVTLALSFILLREPMKPQVLIGGGLVLAGMLVLVWK
jgi:transporter family protein